MDTLSLSIGRYAIKGGCAGVSRRTALAGRRSPSNSTDTQNDPSLSSMSMNGASPSRLLSANGRHEAVDLSRLHRIQAVFGWFYEWWCTKAFAHPALIMVRHCRDPRKPNF